MTGGFAVALRLLPLRFQQALIAETDEQRIKCARFQSGLLRELIAVLPRARLPQHGGDQFARLNGVVRLARHKRNINICRVYLSSTFSLFLLSLKKGKPTSQEISLR